MLTDIWAGVGEFVCEHYEAGLIVGLILLVVAVIAQFIINSSLEEEIIDLTERIEFVEMKCGIEYSSDDSLKNEGEE